VIRRATTICGGVAIVLSLPLPVEPAHAARAGQTVPPAKDGTTTPYEARWTTTVESTGTVAQGAIVVAGGRVVLAGEGLPLQARAVDTGQVVWSRTAITGQLTADAQRVVGTSSDALQAVALADGRPLWSVPLNGGATSHVALDGDLVIVAAGTDLRAHLAETGTVVWQQRLEADATIRPIVVEHRVIVATGARVRVFDRQTGVPSWQLPVDSAPSALAAARDTVVLSTATGYLCALDLPDGDIDWCFRTTPVPVAGPPLVRDDLVYAALLDNTLRAFQLGGGTLARLERLPSRPAAGPFGAGEFLAVPLTNGAFALVPGQPGAPIALAPAKAPPDQRLLGAGVSSDGAWLVSLSIDVSGRRSLMGYGRAATGSAPAAPK
jgi:outer membrane protein assembly factor BamB